MIGGGTYTALAYRSISNIEVDSIELTKLNVNFTRILCILNLTISTNYDTEVGIQGGLFDLYLNGTAIGNGTFGEVSVSIFPKSVIVNITVPFRSLSPSMQTILINYMFGSTDIYLEILITAILVYGYAIPVNINHGSTLMVDMGNSTTLQNNL